MAISYYNRHSESRFPTVVDKKPCYQPHSGVLDQKPNSSANAIWYLDSGATDHVTRNPSDIHLHGPVLVTPSVQITNGNQIPLMHSSSSKFSVGSSRLLLKNILHVPTMKRNLLSIKKLCDDNGLSVTFDSSCVFVKDWKTNEQLITRGVADGLYQLELGNKSLLSINLGIKVPVSTWHAQLKHYNERMTKDLVQEFNLPISSTCMLKCQSLVLMEKNTGILTPHC